jgi:hypothetical protein
MPRGATTARPRDAATPTPQAATRMRVRVDAERIAAARDVWRALWTSRLLVWVAGAGVVAMLGSGPVRRAFDPPGVTSGFGWLGDVLAAPAARWDADWYLVIAHYGYRPDLGALAASRTAFFPLYPLGLRALSDVGLAPVVAGVALSLAAFAAGLYALHRLTTLEVARLGRRERAAGARAYTSALGGEGLLARLRGDGLLAGLRGGGPPVKLDARGVARLVVLLTAFAPMAFFFSAVYSESLYLALSVGVFLCARRGRWASAALLAALASATRSTGIVLMLPIVMLYLYGPREDRLVDYVPNQRRRAVDATRAPDGVVSNAWKATRERATVGSSLGSLRPRYRLRRDALWIVLAPVGLGLYMAHLALAGGDALAPFHAEAVWSRQFAGPFGGVWDGAKAAFEGLRQLLSLQSRHVYYPAAGGSPSIAAAHNLLLFVFLLAAVPVTIGALRLLPPAYGVYVLAALALPLSYPVAAQPLMSLPRFLLVLFPLSMWFAVYLSSRPPVLRWAVLVSSGLAMAFFVGEFATWHWVA